MEKKELKVRMPPGEKVYQSVHIAKMPENFCKLDELPLINPKQMLITHSVKKDITFFQIEDKNKKQPEYYEGLSEDCSHKASEYLAFVIKNNEVRVLPVKNWIPFYKNVKYMDEEEYNKEVKKREEQLLKNQKGKRANKMLMKKKAEEEEEEKEKQANNEKNSDSEQEKPAVLGKRKRAQGDSDIEPQFESEDEEAMFFEKFTQNKILPQTTKILKKENEAPSNNASAVPPIGQTAPPNETPKPKTTEIELSDSGSSDNRKDESFDDEYPELIQNN